MATPGLQQSLRCNAAQVRGESVEVLPATASSAKRREPSLVEIFSDKRRRQQGRHLLAAPAPDAAGTLPNSNLVGTGQKPSGGRADPALLFTNPALQPGTTMAAHTGFGLEKPPKEAAGAELDALPTIGAPQLAAPQSLLQEEPSSRLWDASVAASQQHAQSPHAAVQTGFGLEQRPQQQQQQGSSFLDVTSEQLGMLGLAAPAAAPDQAIPPLQLSMRDIGIGLAKPPGKGSMPAAQLVTVSDAVPAAAAAAASPAAGELQGLASFPWRQQQQVPGAGQVQAASLAAASVPAAGSGGNAVAQAAPAPALARRRLASDWKRVQARSTSFHRTENERGSHPVPVLN
jgi:hypothetical protein